MSNEHKQYLRDGVYANFDGYHVVLITEDGISTTNEIFIEDQLAKQLIDYIITKFSQLKS